MRFLTQVFFVFYISLTIRSVYAATTAYVYDDLNRLHQVWYDGTSYIEYNYDTIGNLLNKTQYTAAPIQVSASPVGGIFNTLQTVVLGCTNGSVNACSSIFYTIDGTNPTANSLLYSSPLQILNNTTLRFFGADSVGNLTPTFSQFYIIDSVPPTTAEYLNPYIKYFTPQTLSLKCTDDNSGCANTYFSVDGSTPTQTPQFLYTDGVAGSIMSSTTTVSIFLRIMLAMLSRLTP